MYKYSLFHSLKLGLVYTILVKYTSVGQITQDLNRIKCINNIKIFSNDINYIYVPIQTHGASNVWVTVDCCDLHLSVIEMCMYNRANFSPGFSK